MNDYDILINQIVPNVLIIILLYLIFKFSSGNCKKNNTSSNTNEVFVVNHEPYSEIDEDFLKGKEAFSMKTDCVCGEVGCDCSINVDGEEINFDNDGDLIAEDAVMSSHTKIKTNIIQDINRDDDVVKESMSEFSEPKNLLKSLMGEKKERYIESMVPQIEDYADKINEQQLSRS